MKASFDDQRYELLWMEWQYTLMLTLGEHLQDAGVKYHVARDVMEKFFFDFAMVHDQHGIELNGEKFVPRIGFTSDQTLLTSDMASHIHEAVHGLIDDAYEEQ